MKGKPKHIPLRIVWVVYDPWCHAVKSYPFSEREKAELLAKELSKPNETFYLAAVKKQDE